MICIDMPGSAWPAPVRKFRKSKTTARNQLPLGRILKCRSCEVLKHVEAMGCIKEGVCIGFVIRYGNDMKASTHKRLNEPIKQ